MRREFFPQMKSDTMKIFAKASENRDGSCATEACAKGRADYDASTSRCAELCKRAGDVFFCKKEMQQTKYSF